MSRHNKAVRLKDSTILLENIAFKLENTKLLSCLLRIADIKGVRLIMKQSHTETVKQIFNQTQFRYMYTGRQFFAIMCERQECNR